MKSLHKNITLLSLGLIFGLGGLFRFLPATAAEEVPVPVIAVNPDVYYPLDEVLYLEGNAAPNFIVQVRFQKQGAKPINFSAKSDSRGEWVLAEKIPLGSGDWEVRVRAVDAQDKEKVSEWSNQRVFKVIVTGITVGGVNIKFAGLTSVIIILLLSGLFIIIYFKNRVRRVKEALLSKEVGEAQESVREGFNQLRQNLLDELQLLESRKDLSKEELVRKEQALRNLEGLEHNLHKEIKDIEEKI